MASPPPGPQNKEDMPENFDDFGEYDVRKPGTPPRRLQVEGTGDQGQPAGSSGSIAINQTIEVANQLRTEMFAVRKDLDAKFNSMKRDIDVSMSGQAYETGALKTLKERVDNIEKSMGGIEDIKEIINDDDRITGMINKYKEFVIDGEAVKKTKT